MAKLLFHLNHVPDDEANEVRQLLSDAEIDFYETDSGRFGLSTAAIWLNEAQQFEQAKSLIDNYQQNRQQSALANYQQRLANGEVPTRWQVFKRSPVVITIALIFVSALAWFSVRPFFG